MTFQAVTAGNLDLESTPTDHGLAATRSAAKVALFLQDLHGGGAERVMLLLAGGLARRGCDVDLVLIRREGAYADSLPPGVGVVELGTGRMLNSIPALARYLRRERPRALLTALVHVNVGALLAAMLARTGTRVIVTEHNQISRNFAALGSLTLRSAYRLVPRLYRRASRIVAVSDGVAEDLSRFSGIGRGRIDVVHNPIVTPELMARVSEPLDDPWFGPGEDRPPVFLGVGRLAAQKDFSTLIRAFAKVRAVRPARLVILGEGEERAALEALVDGLGLRAYVRLPGFAANPYAYMSRADAFVLSSRFEGLPTVLVEAMACGTQVVATDCPSGPREILHDDRRGDRLGGLVPVGDGDALARAMLDAVARPTAVELLRGRAADFGIDRAVDRYLDLVTQEQA